MSNLVLVQGNLDPVEYMSNSEKDDNWEERIADLMDKLISPLNAHSQEDYEKKESIVLEEYRKMLEIYKIVPSLSDMVMACEQYNWDIIIDIATVQFFNSTYNPYYYKTDECKHKAIVEFASDWMEWNYAGYFSELDNFIENILVMNKYCYSPLEDADIWQCIETDTVVDIYIMDCQNNINDEWYKGIEDEYDISQRIQLVVR